MRQRNPRPIPLDAAVDEDVRAIARLLAAHFGRVAEERESERGQRGPYAPYRSSAEPLFTLLRSTATTGRRRVEQIIAEIQIVEAPDRPEVVLSGSAGFRKGRPVVGIRVNGRYRPSQLAAAFSGENPSALPRLRSVLRHELTHVGDWAFVPGATPSYVAPEGQPDDPSAYHNDPLEVRAFMREVVDDVSAVAQRIVRVTRPKELVERALEQSSIWSKVEPHLSEANRRKILQAAYRAIQTVAETSAAARKKNPIVLWHGGRPWEGPPSILPRAPTAMEHGPGIYLTTGADTARHYGRGGGTVLRVELADDVRWLDDVRVSVDDAKGWVKEESGLRKKRDILADLDRFAERTKRPDMPARVLVNLAVNHRALGGEHGPSLARWLAAHGADADRVDPPLFTTREGNEDWVVVFNPAKIVSVRRAPPADVRDLPRVVAQIAALRAT